MTSLPASRPAKRLGLAIDLDTCVGCQACVVNCKEWNTGGYPAPLSDRDPYGAKPLGAWLNRVHTFEAGEGADGPVAMPGRPYVFSATPWELRRPAPKLGEHTAEVLAELESG